MTNDIQTEMRPVVRLSNARKAFGGSQVLKDISLEVLPGEVVAIIGPSGGGKSTLLRCLTLLERLDGGALSYSAKDGSEIVVARPDGDDPDAPAVYADKRELARAREQFRMATTLMLRRCMRISGSLRGRASNSAWCFRISTYFRT